MKSLKEAILDSMKATQVDSDEITPQMEDRHARYDYDGRINSVISDIERIMDALSESGDKHSDAISFMKDAIANLEDAIQSIYHAGK
jgi:hypothetical protein